MKLNPIDIKLSPIAYTIITDRIYNLHRPAFLKPIGFLYTPLHGRSHFPRGEFQ